MSAPELRCPHCGAAVDARTAALGVDLIQAANGGRPYTDLLGGVIRSHRIGTCPACWGIVELVNGRVATVLLVPRPE